MVGQAAGRHPANGPATNCGRTHPAQQNDALLFRTACHGCPKAPRQEKHDSFARCLGIAWGRRGCWCSRSCDRGGAEAQRRRHGMHGDRPPLVDSATVGLLNYRWPQRAFDLICGITLRLASLADGFVLFGMAGGMTFNGRLPLGGGVNCSLVRAETTMRGFRHRTAAESDVQPAIVVFWSAAGGDHVDGAARRRVREGRS